MNIRKITQSILFFIFSLYALQVEAGIILDLGTAEAPAGGSANVSLEIRSDGGTHQIEGGSVIINYDASILVPNLDSIATPLGSSWSVTAGPAPSGPPGSSISTDSFQLTFFPAVTGSPIPVIASSQEIAIIPVTVSANRAVKRAEMLFDPETFNVEVGLSAGEQEQHVFATFDNGGVTVTDWTAVYQNATDTLSEDTLAGNLYFQIYKDGGEKYARYWLFKGENASGVKEGWYKEYRGRDSGTNLFNIRAKYFNWSVDNSLLNLTGAITESGITDSSWTRIFAALPGATSHQLALYGGVTVDGSNTPLLRKIDRNFTVQAVGDLPYILKFNDEDRPEWSEVVLLSSDGTARSGSSDGEKGSFSWRIGTGAESAIKRGALIISGTSLVGETFEEEVYVLADSEEGELLTVSITDEGFEQKRVEVLVSEGFSAVTDLKNQTWQYTDASGDNDDEISFFDISSTSTLLVNGIAETGFSGEEKEGYVKVPFSWAVDTSGTLFMESLAYGNERIIKVNSGKGYMEIVFLDDPEGVEQLISGFSRFDTFDASDGATLWLSRETSGDDGTKRLTLNVGGLGDKKISDLAVSFGYDCLPGRLVKVGVINVTPSTQDCADGYTHQVMHSFDATGTGDGLLLDLDFQVDGNFLRVDLNSADATDSLGNKIDFVRLEGSDIVGKSLILVAEIDVYNKNSGQIETVTIAAPQSWFDPTTNQLKLPSSHVELNELLGNLADRDYETVSLVSGTSDAGAGFNIRFAIYEDVNGDFFIDPADGDTFSSSLTTELVRVNDGYNDPYKNDFVEEGWYIVDRFGNMDQLNDGDVVDAVTGVDTVGGVAVEYGQIVMLDVMEFSSNGEGGPRNQPVVLEGAVFDSQTNAVILPSMIQLEDFWTALQYQDATIQISNDASGTVNETILPPPEAGDATSTLTLAGRGFVFVVQVYDGVKDATTGTVQIASAAKPVFSGELELVKVTMSGELDGVTFSSGDYTDPFCSESNTATGTGCSFDNNGWYIHSYNDEIDQDVLWPVMGGDWINGSFVEYDGDGNSVDQGGGFGGEERSVLNGNVSFVLAQMDFVNNALGTQYPLSTASLTNEEGNFYVEGNQYVKLPHVAYLPDGDASGTNGFADLKSMNFDPNDPKMGKGHLFKLLAFEDQDGSGTYTNGEKVLEMEGMVVYLETKTRSPDGDRTIDPSVDGRWHRVFYSQDGDEVNSYSDTDVVELFPYVEIAKANQGGRAQEGGCEVTNNDRCNSIGVISGKIVDGEGKTIPNLWINFEPIDWNSAEWGGTNTKADGTFTIKLTGNSRYRVWIDTFGAEGGYIGGFYNGRGGVTSEWHEATEVEATRLGNEIGSITMAQGIIVNLVITDGTGLPISDLWVNFEPDGEGMWAGNSTNKEGSTSIGVTKGDYRINVDTYGNDGGYIGGFYDVATGHVTGDWGQATVLSINQDQTINISLATGLRLTGSVLDSTNMGVGDAGISVRSKVTENVADTEQFFGGWQDPFAGGFQAWTQTSCVGDTDKPWCNSSEGGLLKGQFSVVVEPNTDYMVEVHTPDGMGGAFVSSAELSTNPDDVTTTDIIEGSLTREWNDQLQEPVYNAVVVGNSSVEIEVKLAEGVSISGKITNPNADDPSDNGLQYAWVDFNSDQGGWGGASTNDQGEFTVQLEPEKSYRMNVWPDWRDEQNGIMGGQVKLDAGDIASADTTGTYIGVITQKWDEASLIPLSTGDSFAINVTATSGVSIEGKVVTNQSKYCNDGAGNLRTNLTDYGNGYCGMGDVHVNAWSEKGFGGRGQPANQDGSFVINVPAASDDDTITDEQYVVDVWTPNGMNAFYGGEKGTVFSWNEAARIDVPSIGSKTGIDLALTSAYSISGRITDSSGNPVSWIWVDAYSKSKDRWMGTSTNNNGFFRMELPSANDYIVQVWGGDRSYSTSYYSRRGSVTEERLATRLDLTSQDQTAINVVLSSGKSISGSVKGLSPGERLWINAWSESQHNGNGAEAVGTVNEDDADFVINGLVSATDYQLDWWHHKYASGFYGDASDSSGYHTAVDWHERSRLDTTTANIEELKIGLSAGVTLTGTLTGMSAAGSKVYINLWSESGKGFGWSEVTASGSDSDSFTIEGLKSATDYILDIHPDYNNDTDYKGGFYSSTTGGLSNWDQKTQIDLSSDVTLSPFSMVSTSGKISGSITGIDAGDKAWVDAWSDRTGSWAGVEITGTDATETFTLKGLDAADDYRVSIWVDGKAGGFYKSNTELTNFWEDANKVTVTDSNTTSNLVLVIESGISIAGTISGLDSGDFAWLDAFDEGLMFGNGTSVTGEGTSTDVAFTIEGMRINDQTKDDAKGYRIMMDAQGYPMQFWNDVTGTATTWDNATLLRLGADSTDQVSFTVSAGNSISGTVTGFDRNDWTFVDAWSKSTGNMGFAEVNKDSVNCDSNDENCTASYTIEGLSAASDYLVGADRGGMRVFYDGDASNGSSPKPDEGNLVSIAGSDVASTDLSFNISTGTLTATISGIDTTATVYVNAWDPQGGFGWKKRVGDGSVVIDKLPQGSYYVSAWTEGKQELFYDASGTQVNNYEAADQLSIGATASTSFSWTGVITNALSGTVTDALDTAIANQLVSAYSSDRYESTMTNSSGVFEFKALLPGTYVVDAWTAVGHLEVVDVVVSGDLGVDTTGTLLKPLTTVNDLTVTAQASSIVGLFDNGGDFVSAGVTDASGTLIFKGLSNNSGGEGYTIMVDIDGDGSYRGAGDASDTHTLGDASTSIIIP